MADTSANTTEVAGLGMVVFLGAVLANTHLRLLPSLATPFLVPSSKVRVGALRDRQVRSETPALSPLALCLGQVIYSLEPQFSRS